MIILAGRKCSRAGTGVCTTRHVGRTRGKCILVTQTLNPSQDLHSSDKFHLSCGDITLSKPNNASSESRCWCRWSLRVKSYLFNKSITTLKLGEIFTDLACEDKIGTSYEHLAQPRQPQRRGCRWIPWTSSLHSVEHLVQLNSVGYLTSKYREEIEALLQMGLNFYTTFR